MFDHLKILAHYLFFRYFRKFSRRDKLLIWQKKQLKKYRQTTIQNFPYLAQFEGDGLKGLPILDKQEMEKHFQGLNTEGLDFDSAHKIAKIAAQGGPSAQYGDITVGMSSGTSGKRSFFLVSSKERYQWLAAILSKIFGSALMESHRVALMLSANSKLYKTMETSKALQFKFFDLTKSMDQHIENLNKFKPTLLVAPSSVLNILADHQCDGSLSINPDKIFSGAEVLTEETRMKVKMAWRQITHQIYQATEGFLGISCSHGTLHLNEEYLHFEQEWIDREKRAFNPIITDFTRTTQAMTRYRMNDILIEAEKPCPCGSPLMAIERIEGRCDDLLILYGHTQQKQLFFPDQIRATILDSDQRIEDFLIEQTDVNKLILSVKGNGWESAANAIKNMADNQALTIMEAPYFSPENHGVKMRRVRRNPMISIHQ